MQRVTRVCQRRLSYLFYFYPLNYDSSISHFLNAFQQVCSWMTANLLLTHLRLNSCSSDLKTNFPKYITLYLTPPTLLEIMASSLVNISPSLTKLHLSPKPITITFANFAAFDLTSIRQHQLPVQLLHLSFTSSLITVFLCTINFLSLNYSVSTRSRNLLLVLSLKLFKVLSYHSHPTLSSLAQDHWTHWIQAPLSYLPSFHNYPTCVL